jgi:hypothetical protein
METICPHCGSHAVATQDIETLSDSALLVKLDKRIQLCCQDCGWISFTDPVLERL